MAHRKEQARYRAAVIGVSAGGMNVLPRVLAPVPGESELTVIIVQHLSPEGGHSFLAQFLREQTGLRVQEAVERERIEKAAVYVAPANYHLLLERDMTLSLSSAEKVNFSRPSIDVLFESAADALGAALIGIILTGASSDGARGLKRIQERGGFTIVQDPETAEAPVMPQAALALCRADCTLPPEAIGRHLAKVCGPKHGG